MKDMNKHAHNFTGGGEHISPNDGVDKKSDLTCLQSWAGTTQAKVKGSFSQERTKTVEVVCEGEGLMPHCGP